MMTSIIRKITKMLSVLLIIQIIFAIVNISEASWVDSAKDFLNLGKNTASSGKIISNQSDNASVQINLPTDSTLKGLINDIYNILFPLAIAITVIMAGVLGIQFMMASAEDKAKVKESMVPYVAGCIVIYGAFGIWKLAITIFSSIG